MATLARLSAFSFLSLLLVVILCSTFTTQSNAIAIISAADDKADDAPQAFDDDDDSMDDDDDDAADDDEDKEDDSKDDDKSPSSAVIDPPGQENASGYQLPDTSKATFVDGFQNGLSQWVHTSVADYNGKFSVGQGVEPTFPGDRALIITDKARKYGLSAPVSGLADMSNKDFALQYEVKIDDSMTCGGAYVKLPTTGFKPESFDGSTIYSIMFGPDRCGATDKTHFIFQSKNPKTGEYVEHHLKDAPNVANAFDKKTHHYGISVKKDGTFELYIDGESRKKGNLMDSFEPPLQPPEKIDDPNDKKPDDWIDEKKIPDPDAKKPDDWDESAPAEIEDMDAEKPEGWLDDEPLKVPDPSKSKPEEWDDEEDGEWEAPLVDNPKCEAAGCGEWKRPMKANPAFKGKWNAPMIDNPKYIGEWKPKQIANDKYYKVEKPTLLPIHGIGFEIWTMDHSVLFDNVWIGTNWEDAKTFADATFGKKQTTEVEREEKKSKTEGLDKKSRSGSLGKIMDKVEDTIDSLERSLEPLETWIANKGGEPYLDKLIEMGIEKPMLLTVTAPLVIVVLFILILGKGKSTSPSPEEQAAAEVAEKKKTDDPTPDDKVDDIAESTSTDVDQEKSVRRRRTATAE